MSIEWTIFDIDSNLSKMSINDLAYALQPFSTSFCTSLSTRPWAASIYDKTLGLVE